MKENEGTVPAKWAAAGTSGEGEKGAAKEGDDGVWVSPPRSTSTLQLTQFVHCSLQRTLLSPVHSTWSTSPATHVCGRVRSLSSSRPRPASSLLSTQPRASPERTFAMQQSMPFLPPLIGPH